MDLINKLPLAPLILLVFFIGLGIVGTVIFILTKKMGDRTEKSSSFESEVNFSVPTKQMTPESNSTPISTKPVRSNNLKYLFLIIISALVAVLIPLVALTVVRKTRIAQTEIKQKEDAISVCRSITITDTLGKTLNYEELSLLRPGDEIKIIIAVSDSNFEKARFRVNGSEWQEVTNKEGNNFMTNYILPMMIKKFTIEAEVYDKDKGWR